MVAGPHPIQTPPPNPEGRLIFIDNLRWSAISMVVVIHAAVTYSGFGSWYMRDTAGTSRAEVIGFATYQSFQHAVAMGILFGIAGYFAGASIARKGRWGFLRERAFRLGLPLLLYVLLIAPVTLYFIVGHWRSSKPFAAAWCDYIAEGEVFRDSGPLWFCLVLLLFSLCLAAMWRRPDAEQARRRPVPGAVQLLGFAFAMALLTFGVGLLAPAGSTVLNIEIHEFPQYPLMFLAGLMAHTGDWPLRFTARAGRWWGIGGIVLGAVAWLLVIALGGALHGNMRAYGGGWHWQAAAMDLWRSGVCVALTLGLITLFRDRFGGQTRWSRFLTRNAFGVYVFHTPILVAITRALETWPADAVLKFALASVTAIVASFLFVGILVRRTPGLRACT